MACRCRIQSTASSSTGVSSLLSRCHLSQKIQTICCHSFTGRHSSTWTPQFKFKLLEVWTTVPLRNSLRSHLYSTVTALLHRLISLLPKARENPFQLPVHKHHCTNSNHVLSLLSLGTTETTTACTLLHQTRFQPKLSNWLPTPRITSTTPCLIVFSQPIEIT